MYDAFPFQLVWTPLAWHGVVTGLGILALHRSACGRGFLRHLSLMVGLGLGFFAGFWPTERQDLPQMDAILQYQVGSGLAAVLGLLLLDRFGQVPRPPRLVALAVLALAALLWLGKTAVDLRAERLALPVMLGLTLWAMRRLGTGETVSFGPNGRLRHGLFLIVPGLVFVAAGLDFRDSAGVPSNIIVAVVLVPLGLGLWLWCLLRAFRTPALPAPK